MKGIDQTRRVVLIAGAAIGLAATAAAPASGSGLPRILSGTYCSGSSCTGVYTLRPHVIVVSVAAGGNLAKLAWSSWSATSATAKGTSIDSNMGTTTKDPIKVTASRVRNGLFTRLAVTFTLASGATQVEKLKFSASQTGWLQAQ